MTLLGIIGVIVCYVKRDEASNTWVASHLTWLIRTFWWSFLWDLIGLVILIVLGLILIGIPIAFGIWFVTAIWVIYRVVRGYLLFKDSKPIPGISAVRPVAGAWSRVSSGPRSRRCDRPTAPARRARPGRAWLAGG